MGQWVNARKVLVSDLVSLLLLYAITVEINIDQFLLNIRKGLNRCIL